VQATFIGGPLDGEEQTIRDGVLYHYVPGEPPPTIGFDSQGEDKLTWSHHVYVLSPPTAGQSSIRFRFVYRGIYKTRA